LNGPGLLFPWKAGEDRRRGHHFSRERTAGLSAAYRFYCGKELVDAHSAEADAEASLEVLLAQLDRYADLPKDMPGLHAFCTKPGPSQVDVEGRLLWRDGEAYFNLANTGITGWRTW
jgi:DNA polymerase-3 subunit epsilon